jgi:hypothetical protein
MLQVFIADVNSQLKFNHGGIIRAIPIVIYHNFVTYPDVSYSKDAAATNSNRWKTAAEKGRITLAA